MKLGKGANNSFVVDRNQISPGLVSQHSQGSRDQPGFAERIYSVIILMLLLTLPACAWIGQRTLADPKMLGRFENNVYDSPRGTFRVRVPPLTKNIKFREESPTPNTVLFSITDELCREFIASERPGLLDGQTLESWVDLHIVKELKSLGFDVQTKTLTTRYGPAVSLRYRAPAAAPCTQATDTKGKRVETKRDADVGWYVFNQGGAFYRLIYVIGLGPGLTNSWFIKREPVEEVLARFADGLEIKSPPKK